MHSILLVEDEPNGRTAWQGTLDALWHAPVSHSENELERCLSSSLRRHNWLAVLHCI
jgi:hypothetical protein